MKLIKVMGNENTISRVSSFPLSFLHSTSTGPGVNLGGFPDDKPILNQLPYVLACKIKIQS